MIWGCPYFRQPPTILILVTVTRFSPWATFGAAWRWSKLGALYPFWLQRTMALHGAENRAFKWRTASPSELKTGAALPQENPGTNPRYLPIQSEQISAIFLASTKQRNSTSCRELRKTGVLRIAVHRRWTWDMFSFKKLLGPGRSVGLVPSHRDGMPIPLGDSNVSKKITEMYKDVLLSCQSPVYSNSH